jgi:transcriptional regulator with XRE-family HTH domain
MSGVFFLIEQVPVEAILGTGSRGDKRMTFAERLRALREGAGLSEAKLADLSGVSFGAIHNYGLGIRKPTFASVVKIARALGTTCQAFAGCEDVGGRTEAKKNTTTAKPSPPRALPPSALTEGLERQEEVVDKRKPRSRPRKTK